MSASLDPKKTARAKKIINEVLEPKIKQLVEETNKVLNKQDIQIGCSVEWYLDKFDLKGESDVG